MILTCPSCATSYFAPDQAIGAGGRTVRCKACAHTWRATLDEPLELTASAEEEPAPSVGRRDETPETLAETPAPELPRAYRARAEHQRRVRRAATHGVAWAGLASVFVALMGAAWLFRVEVVDLAPRTAAAYAAVGIPVNPTGLEFEAVSARAVPNDPGTVVVSGALRNVRDREVTAPAVRVALLDTHGAEIGHAVVRIDAAPVLPGGVQGFAVLIPDPGSKASGVGVDFVLATDGGDDRKKDPSHAGHGAEHGPAASDDHGPAAPAPRPLPTADQGSLRPALSPMSDDLPTMRPLDAVPVETAPLDKSHDEAVSASHHG